MERPLRLFFGTFWREEMDDVFEVAVVVKHQNQKNLVYRALNDAVGMGLIARWRPNAASDVECVCELPAEHSLFELATFIERECQVSLSADSEEFMIKLY